MKWTSYLAIAGVAASLAALPAAAHAQRGARLGPAERVLAQRAELSLTADQVTRLERIRDSYAEKEKPWVDEMRKHMPEPGEPGERGRRGARRERPDLPPAAKAAMDSLRTSRESARGEVAAVLTDAQRAQMKEMAEERRERRPRQMRRQADSARIRGA
jgi:hypothetical protein